MASASEGSLPQTVFDLEASGMIKSWKSIREAVHLSELAMASLDPDGKDFDMQARVKAASALGEETVFEILDDIEVFDTVNRAVSGNGGVALDIASICDQVCQPQGQSSCTGDDSMLRLSRHLTHNSCAGLIAACSPSS